MKLTMVLNIPEKIGERVRAARRKAGWTRAQLSQKSQVSERYLARLEKGTANVSISVLVRILKALEISSFDIFDPFGEGSAVDAARNNTVGLALIGLRGAGKTTLGTQLAQATGVPFVRLTAEIEEIAGISVDEIFSLGGVEAFRRMEKDAIDRIVARHKLVIVETSGGIVANEQAYEAVLSRFNTVWLEATPKDHMNRVVEQGDMRPISGHAQAMEHLKTLLKTRTSAYARARTTLNTSKLTENECIARLQKMIKHLQALASA